MIPLNQPAANIGWNDDVFQLAGYRPQGITGTVETLLAGAPSITLRLMARYTRVLCLASHRRVMLVNLNSNQVL